MPANRCRPLPRHCCNRRCKLHGNIPSTSQNPAKHHAGKFLADQGLHRTTYLTGGMFMTLHVSPQKSLSSLKHNPAISRDIDFSRVFIGLPYEYVKQLANLLHNFLGFRQTLSYPQPATPASLVLPFPHAYLLLRNIPSYPDKYEIIRY